MSAVQNILTFLNNLKNNKQIYPLINLSFVHNDDSFVLRFLNFIKSHSINSNEEPAGIYSKITSMEPLEIEANFVVHYDYLLNNIFRNKRYLELNDLQMYYFALILVFLSSKTHFLENAWGGFVAAVTPEVIENESDDLDAYPSGLPEDQQYKWDYLGTRSWGIPAKKNIRHICAQLIGTQKRIVEDDWDLMFYRDNKCYIDICNKYGLDASEIVC